MRLAALALAVTGCAFTGDPGGPTDDPNDVDDDPVDPSDPIVVRSCSAAIPADVRLCIDFEDPSLAAFARDGSGQLNDAAALNVTPMTRVVEGTAQQAAQLGEQSSLHVAETAALDLESFTLEMWIRPDAVPATAFGLLDNFGQYTMQYESQGQLRCGVGPDTVDGDVELARGEWHHVACRYDASKDEMRVYVDGSVSDCDKFTTTATEPTAGTAIGARIAIPTGPVVTFQDHFRGGIDNVRVYSGAITSGRLCAAAGQRDCNSSCPKRDEDGGGRPGPGGGDDRGDRG